jgi:hypothetical protein
MKTKNMEFVAQAVELNDTVCVIDKDDRVWRLFNQPWWNVAAWLWWVLTPGRKCWLIVALGQGEKVRMRACCIGERYVRMGNKKG